MTYAKKNLSEIKLIHGDYGNFIKGQKLPNTKEKKYKEPPYQDLTASTELEGEPLDEKCWPGYEKKGMKTMFGKRYPNCVKKKKTKKEEFSDWRSELEQIEEKKMTKAQIKKRDEIADAISTKDMKDRYGDKNVKYAIATKLAMKEDNIQEILDKKDIPHVKKLVGKLRKGSKTHAKQADDLEKAMKENTAIESELVIQDWNKDDIKFTEIETIDIIKAKPLKENVDLYEGFKTRMIAKFGKKLLKNIGKVNPFTKTGAERVTQGVGQVKKYVPPDKVTSQNIQTKSVVNQAKKMVDMSKKPNKGTKAVKVDLSKPIDFDKYLGKSPTPLEKKFVDKRPTGTFTDDLPPVKNSKPKKPLKDHYDWRTELDEDWQKVNRKDKTDGLSRKAVKAYRRENPGSKLQTAVTKDPKKLKKGSKSAKRRLSFCRRMKGMKKKLTSAKTARDPDSRINKALRRWNC